MIEFIVAHAQAVARLPGVNGVSAVGEGIAHVLQRAGGGEQFGFGEKGHDRAAAKGANATPAAAGFY
ncbi:hypothetical protein D3C80_1314170 [compost metagenome]